MFGGKTRFHGRVVMWRMQAGLQQLCEWVFKLLAWVLSLFSGGSGRLYFESTKISVELDVGGDGEKTATGAAGALGEGAFSTVYRATDIHDSSRLYAVKKMFIQSPEFERALYQEIDSFQRFRHPNILRMIDSQVVVKDGVKIAYLLFPLMRRGSLRDELNRTVLSGGAGIPAGVRLMQVLTDFAGIVGAFNVLHTHSPPYVHQDVKPENVLIADDGKPLLTDFGSVRLAEISVTNRAQAMAVAEEAASFCTVSYRAPELFDPPKGCTLDTRTDVWGLGCLLFAWWFGLSPWESEFGENGRPRVTDCSHSRVLSKMPRPLKPTKEDAVILDLCEWVLEKNFAVRVFTSDIIVRLGEVSERLAVQDLKKGGGSASNV